VPEIAHNSDFRYRWAAAGDVNAFFGLMLDNVADLVLTVSLLAMFFGFPVDFALNYMAPGTAIGVLVGDVLFFCMALRLARRTRRNTITAMPLGLDTPSTFGMVFFVLGPAFLEAKQAALADPANLADPVLAAATTTWHVGICSIVISGVFKFACALGSNWVRRVVPRAALLGSLAAIALVLISFLPLLEILHYPVVGLVAIAVILTTLVARVRLPFRIPGTLGALLVGAAIYYGMKAAGILGHHESLNFEPQSALMPSGWLEVFRFEWVSAMPIALKYLPIVIPFALATVIGGIDCTESAAAAGDEYDTGQVVGVEAAATVVAGLCGGVIQTTPYIGHPAYKAMGGRAAYTLATALFIGGAGVLGYFGYIYAFIPKPAVYPILIFIGLEITAQSFRATPRAHYPAVVLACVPALAALAMIFMGDLQGQYQGQVAALNTKVRAAATEVERELGPQSQAAKLLDEVEQQGQVLQAMAGNAAAGVIGEPQGPLGKTLQTLRMLSGGFILTSLLWAALLAKLIDVRLISAAVLSLIAAMCSLFGAIHSPMPGGPLIVPWDLPPNLPQAAAGQTPFYMAAGYAAVAVLLVVWAAYLKRCGGAVVEAEPAETEPPPQERDTGHA